MGLFIALGVILADQISKMLVYGLLAEVGGYMEITSFFNLVTAWNTGVSFSMLNNLGGYGVYILSAFSLGVVGFLFYWMMHEENKPTQVALGMVIGGAVGNVIDRIRIGAVFDFLDFHYNMHHWPAFNLADSFICIGAAIIVFQGFFCSENKKITTTSSEG